MLLAVGTEEAGSGQAGAQTGAFPARKGGSAEPQCCVKWQGCRQGLFQREALRQGMLLDSQTRAAVGPLPERCLHGEVFIPV